MQSEPLFQQEKLEDSFKKAHTNILLTASWLNLQTTKSLKPFHISPQQFNVLSILHQFHPKPVTIKMLTQHMMDQMSNASRLVEKLKMKGLVERKACDEDRRRVDIYITASGLELLEKVTKTFETNIKKHFNQLKPADVHLLNNILEQLRS